MIIENLNGLIVIHAEGTNKITNKDRSFFSDMIYLGVNDSIENYNEVSRDIWKHLVIEDNIDIEELKLRIDDAANEKALLEDCLLDTDYRLLNLEIKLEEI